jgi:hypothetical protein
VSFIEFGNMAGSVNRRGVPTPVGELSY